MKIVYGKDMPADRRIAERFGTVSGVELNPLDTGVHGIAGVLKREGKLGPLIVDTIRAGAEKSGAELKAVA